MGAYKTSAICLIWYGDKVMLAKRRGSKHWNGYYAAIGGKIEKGETIVRGLIREIQEEADIFVYYPTLILKDCIIDEETKTKVFIFETGIFPSDFSRVKNTEPKKRHSWRLFTKSEALKLKLIPRLKSLIEDTDIKSLEAVWK